MKMKTVNDLMINGMTYALDFEEQIADAAKDMADASTNPELKQLFEKTGNKSKEYAQKVEATFAKLGAKAERNTNHIAVAMIKEVQGMIGESDPGAVRDAALIVAANQQQQFRVATYGSLASYAKLLGKEDAASGLKENLDDSKGGDEKFTQLADSKVNQEALAA